MARSQIASENYNLLYAGIKSFTGQRGMSCSIKTFFDGSAIVNINVSASNTSVTVSAIIVALYENDRIVGYRVSNEDKSLKVDKIQECIGFCRTLVNDTRVILSKI